MLAPPVDDHKKASHLSDFYFHVQEMGGNSLQEASFERLKKVEPGRRQFG